MNDLQLGYALSLGTAVCWAVAVVLFRKSGAIDALSLNLFKTVIGFSLLLVTGLWVGFEGASDDPLTWLALAGSGALGIGLADTLLFEGLALIGASRMAVVDAIYTPMVVLLSYVLHGERLSLQAGAGGALVLVALALAAGESHGDLTLERARLLRGVTYGAISVSLMAVAIVLIKPLLAGHGVLWCTSTRVGGAVVVMGTSVLLRPSTRARVRGAFKPQPSWRYAIPGAVISNYVTLLMWIGAFKYAPSGVAALLNQTSTFFVVLLAAVFLGEKLTRRLLLALALASLGGLIVLL